MTTPTDTLRRAIAKHGLTEAEAAKRLEISEDYLAAILAKKLSISAYVAVRAEVHLDVSAQKILLDQAFTQLYKARVKYEAAQATHTEGAQA